MNNVDPRVVKALKILSDRIESQIYNEVKKHGNLTDIIPKQVALDREWEIIDKILRGE